MFDEAIILTGALRVLGGDVLHRDFYANYGPAQFHLVAELFRALGPDFLAARLLDLTIRAGIAGVLFHIIARHASGAMALSAAALAVLWMIGLGNFLYPVFPCLLLALLGSSRLVALGTPGPPRREAAAAGLGAGVCAGLCLLFRYDAGVLLAIANLTAVAVLTHRANRPGQRLAPLLLAGGAYGAGLLAVAAPALALFLAVSPLAPLLHDIVDYGANIYPAMRRLPFPGPAALAADPRKLTVYLPLLAIVLAWATLGRARAGPRLAASGPAEAALVVFGLAAGLFILKGVVRVSPLHMFLALGPSLVVLAIVLHSWRRAPGAGRLLAPLLALLVAVPALATAARELPGRHEPGRSMLAWLIARGGPNGAAIGLADACARGPASGLATLRDDYGPVARYLNAQTRPGEPILVGLTRHDRIFVNPLGLYFAAGRLPGTHWHQYDPGLQTRADVQRAMIEDLRRNRVNWVVRDGSSAAVREPNESARSSGVRLLDAYLDRHYRLAASVGAVQVWAAAELGPRVPAALSPCPVTPRRPQGAQP